MAYEYSEWERGQVATVVMNPGSSIIATYEGILCTVLSAPPPPPPPPPPNGEEEKKFPWLLVGLGAAVAIFGLLTVTTKGGR